MKVLLIQAPQGLKEQKELAFPLGLAYLATALKNHEPTVFDPNITKQPFNEMEKILKKTTPDVIGVSLRNIDTCASRAIFNFYPYYPLAVF